MSLLPQRKKSAEEIAKLRESFGLPDQVSGGKQLMDDASAGGRENNAQIAKFVGGIAADLRSDFTAKTPASASVATIPVASSISARPLRSLKRSERSPVQDQIIGEPDKSVSSATTFARDAKYVHSFKKSEMEPCTPADIHIPPANSKLPGHRHDDRELKEIRRYSAIDMQATAHRYTRMKAHFALVIFGYLLAIGSGAVIYFYESPMRITAGGEAFALLIAAFILIKKPLSRHHAAFIAVIAFFVIVFGALHYFPQFQHGT
jgi:hypothetical protein